MNYNMKNKQQCNHTVCQSLPHSKLGNDNTNEIPNNVHDQNGSLGTDEYAYVLTSDSYRRIIRILPVFLISIQLHFSWVRVSNLLYVAHPPPLYVRDQPFDKPQTHTFRIRTLWDFTLDYILCTLFITTNYILLSPYNTIYILAASVYAYVLTVGRTTCGFPAAVFIRRIENGYGIKHISFIATSTSLTI